jgi:hypothetical protein
MIMRTDPAVKYEKETKAEMQKRIDGVTRKVAIGFVLAIIIFFYLKMLIP